jgi:type IV pilus assembly protein PilA
MASNADLKSGSERGFTLVELLVVVLIIAILAAIAIPLFLSQRQRAFVADIRSAFRNAATAAESYGTEREGNYSTLNGDDGTLLSAQGYNASSAVSISVASTPTTYCLTVTYSLLPASHDWKVSTWDKSDGFATEADTC